jgi:hypothetical protein
VKIPIVFKISNNFPFLRVGLTPGAVSILFHILPVTPGIYFWRSHVSIFDGYIGRSVNLVKIWFFIYMPFQWHWTFQKNIERPRPTSPCLKENL